MKSQTLCDNRIDLDATLNEGYCCEPTIFFWKWLFRALFSCNARFEIQTLVLLPTKYAFSDLNILTNRDQDS